MNRNGLILYLIAVCIASVSQILLKVNANKKYNTRIKEYINGLVFTSYSLFVLSLVMATLALKKIDYKYGTIIDGTSYLFVVIGSSVILKEKVTKRKLLGMSIIFIGIVVFIR